jgi:hypothetical protein
VRKEKRLAILRDILRREGYDEQRKLVGHMPAADMPVLTLDAATILVTTALQKAGIDAAPSRDELRQTMDDPRSAPGCRRAWLARADRGPAGPGGLASAGATAIVPASRQTVERDEEPPAVLARTERRAPPKGRVPGLPGCSGSKSA